MADEDRIDRQVNVPCLCPDKGHEAGDTITMRETLDFLAVRAVRYAAQMEQDDDSDISIPSLLAVMSEGYILHGVEAWTVQDKDDKGRLQPVEVTRGNVRKYLLSDMVASQIIGDFADVLYRPQVFLPLAELARRSSQPSPTSESILPENESSSTSPTPMDGSANGSSTPSEMPQKRSRRSSTTSTPMDSTGEILAASAGGFTS